MRFDEHDDRYARTEEWLRVVDGAWKERSFSFKGKYYEVDELVLEPKPASSPRPTVYAGGESETAKALIARHCDAYVMHGDPPDVIGARIADMKRRREALGLPPLKFGVAAYSVVRSSDAEVRREIERITNVSAGSPGYRNYQEWIGNTKLERTVSLEEYSVSNRGLRAGLVGSPDQVADRVAELERVGVDLVLLQCSPQLEEMERFAEQVIRAPRSVSAA